MQFLFVYLYPTFFQEGLKMAYGDAYGNTSKFTWAENVEAKIKSVRKKDGTGNTFSIEKVCHEIEYVCQEWPTIFSIFFRLFLKHFKNIYLFLIDWWWLYNIDLISVIHQHELTIGVHMSPHSRISLPPPTFSHPTRLLQLNLKMRSW